MFDRVSDIIEVNHASLQNDQMFLDKIVKSIVFKADRSREINIVLLDHANYLEQLVAEVNSKRVTTVPDLGFYFLRDFTLRGRGFLFSGDRLLDRRDVIPEYVRHCIDNKQWGDLYPDAPLPSRRIIGPALLLTSEAYFIYGHWLVDILPKAWLYKARFGKQIEGLKLLLPHDVPKYGLDILIDIFDFDPKNFEYYNWQEEDVILDKAIVPSLLHDDYMFHPETNSYVDFVLSRCTNVLAVEEENDNKNFEDGDLIYVSRHSFRKKNATIRNISNEDNVHSIVRDNGFTIVCPEELSWVEQVRVFAKAKVIVGEAGSGLHNTIFCRRNAVVLCFRSGTHVQATIGALREQTLVLLYPTEEAKNNGNTEFKIDEQRLVLAIEGCKRFALAQL